jgi:4-hydroxy-3-polyprenylbenzoate decarboxylase
MGRKKIVVGVSGASGTPLALKFVREAKSLDIEMHVVLTKAAEKVAYHEMGIDLAGELGDYAENLYYEDDIDAPIASTSYLTDGMVIIPCSMNTVAKIANGVSDNLLLRAADNHIRMKRKLVIIPREAPLSPIHLENLRRLSSLCNVYILFPVLTYYHKPSSIEEMEKFIVGKILDILGIENSLYNRWGENE